MHSTDPLNVRTNIYIVLPSPAGGAAAALVSPMGAGQGAGTPSPGLPNGALTGASGGPVLVWNNEMLSPVSGGRGEVTQLMGAISRRPSSTCRGFEIALRKLLLAFPGKSFGLPRIDSLLDFAGRSAGVNAQVPAALVATCASPEPHTELNSIGRVLSLAF